MKYGLNVSVALMAGLFIVGCGGGGSSETGSTGSIGSAGSTGSTPSTNVGGVIVNTADRQEVLDYYNDVYLASSLESPIEWTGDQTTCDAGTTSAEFKESVLARINYFRAMAGVPSNVLLDATFSEKAQKAALMMSVNSQLNHFPPNTWDCYSEVGYEAAGKSNLALANGSVAINVYIRDDGLNNTQVGHRRWLLLPQIQSIGTGDIPASGGYPAANAVWVVDGHFSDQAPTTRDSFVAWPAKGYNPYQVVPVRWSLSYPNADFTNASVVVSQEGTAIPVLIDNIEFNILGQSDIIPTIVWRLNNMTADGITNWPIPASDTDYDVQVSNVVINGNSTDFNYTVTVFKP